ncbi:MAG TPA: 2-phosphosulfolactate phosphatase [Candidatus Dormibacteraeota bacterium]|nr:2-phosphosulfolactate phosphatase [Candidatus Dormibacteraeota bacterium]
MQRVGVRRLRLIEGAQAANGAAVIIDVLRAATTVAFAIAAGVERVLLVDSAESARELRATRFRNAILAGEVDGVRIADFDFDNSPAQMEAAPLRGRVLVLRTSSGTQGVMAARKAEAIFLAGFVTASATARVLKAGSRVASLVAMGERGLLPAEEDEACAAYIESLLRGRPLPAAALVADVRKRLRDDHPAPTWRADVERSFAVDRFDFAIEVVREDGLAVAKRA